MNAEQELWDLFRDGDETSFSKLFDLYHGLLYNYGHKFTGNDEIIDDSIQDLFAKLWNNKNSIQATASVKNYLFKAFRRTLTQRLLREDRFSLLKTNAEKNIPFQIELPHDNTLIQQERLHEIRTQLENALTHMTPRQREIIHLKFYEDMSYEEIAQVMGLSAKGTYKLLYRAIDSLREHVSNFNLLVLLWLAHRV